MAKLTPREHDVLQDMVEGKKSKETMQRLGIAVGTVKIHRTNVLQKLGCTSAVHLRQCIANGTVVPPELPLPQTAE